jgi:hypothetical protein
MVTSLPWFLLEDPTYKNQKIIVEENPSAEGQWEVTPVLN